MKTSNQGIALIKKHEGCKLDAYVCPAGKLTIGYGHTGSVKKSDKITQDQADVILRQDVAFAEQEVNKLSNLTQNQFDALVSFVFNVGRANFFNSTLRKKIILNSKDVSIRKEFERWIYANKVELRGLAVRRKDEADLYFKI